MTALNLSVTEVLLQLWAFIFRIQKDSNVVCKNSEQSEGGEYRKKTKEKRTNTHNQAPPELNDANYIQLGNAISC